MHGATMKTVSAKQNACFDFLYKFCLNHFSFCEEFSEILSKMCREVPVKCPLLLSGFNETWIFSTDLKKKKTPKHYIPLKFVQNGSCVVLWGWTDAQIYDQANYRIFAILGTRLKTS